MRRARLVSLIRVVLFLIANGSPLEAQWQFTADAGIARLQQSGIPESNALTLGASLDLLGERGSFRTSLLNAHADDDRWTIQGVLLASLLGAPGRSARWELAGAASTFGETGELPTVSGELMPRIRFDGGTGARGGALGFGAGTIARNQSLNAFYHGQADGWLSASNDQLIGTLSVVRRTAAVNPAVPSLAAVANATRVLSYADGAMSWRHEQGALSLGATAGVRVGLQGIDNTDAWGSADVTAWMNTRSALVLSIGRTLDDVVRGVPRTRFASIALRISARPHVEVPKRPRDVGPRVSIERSGDGRQRLEVRVASATRVELMADFTDWNPVVLEQIDGVWRLERAITPGLHRIALRIDGGEWIAPGNLPHATDDLGGIVGLITIPQ
jgi:hypothetical protein